MMANALYRLLIVLGAICWAGILGTALGGKYLISPGQGLAGPVEALGYGVLAALVSAIIAVILTKSWPTSGLRRVSVLVFGSAMLLVVYIYSVYAAKEKSRQDPDSAYVEVSAFTASWEQQLTQDPYLRTRMEVDATERSWVSRGPAPIGTIFQAIVVLGALD